MIGNLNEEHLSRTADLLNIHHDFLRKDYYVTKAIACISTFEDEYFSLVFQGGTSLAKAHLVVKRFSEDIDLRVIYKSADKTLTTTGQRKRLGDLRKKIIILLKNNGFDIPKEYDDEYKGKYNHQHMFINATYDSLDSPKKNYKNPHEEEVSDPSQDSDLKSHIQIEFYFSPMELHSERKEFSTLIKKTLGNKSEHLYFSILCMSVDEIATEKWLALIRRIFESMQKTRKSDRDLVRHMYDLYQLYISSLLQEKKRFIIKKVLAKEPDVYTDRQTFIEHTPRFIAETAIEELKNNIVWQIYWERLNKMTFENIKPNYFEALSIIQKITSQYLAILEDISQ